MDPQQFDQLARALGRAASRRGAIGAVTGGALALLGPVAPAAAGKKRRRGAGRDAAAGTPPGKVVLCHQGHEIDVAEPAVPAHLAHGDTLGPCGAPGQGTCVPNDQVCSLLSPFRCCGDKTFCRTTGVPPLSTCQTSCNFKSPNADAECQTILGYPDVQCENDFVVCAGSRAQCCRPKACSKSSDCKGGGPCCPGGLGGSDRCCAPGQVCASFGGCATTS